MIEFDVEEFKKKYPHLAEEVFGDKGIKVKFDIFRGYRPGVIDFIRRCDTEEEAIEIVNYLERRGELTQDEAEEIRRKIRREGVRSFGPKKDNGWYLKQAGY
jgi:hypothetical protein